MKEDGADARIKFHLDMWSTLSMKAKGDLNMPDVNELENLKNINNRLVPRSQRYNTFFTNLSSNESIPV